MNKGTLIYFIDSGDQDVIHGLSYINAREASESEESFTDSDLHQGNNITYLKGELNMVSDAFETGDGIDINEVDKDSRLDLSEPEEVVEPDIVKYQIHMTILVFTNEDIIHSYLEFNYYEPTLCKFVKYSSGLISIASKEGLKFAAYGMEYKPFNLKSFLYEELISGIKFNSDLIELEKSIISNFYRNEEFLKRLSKKYMGDLSAHLTSSN